MDRVLVIGGSGFLGRKIVAALTGRGGYRVTSCGRHPSLVDNDAIETVTLDAADGDALSAALADADYVVNAMMGRPSAMTAVAANLVSRAGPGVRRIVHISSLAVYGACSGDQDEDTGLVRQPSGGYAGAKWEAERHLLRSGIASRVFILRPGCIYGPGGRQWVDCIGRLIARGKLGFLGEEGSGACHAVHVDDVAEGVLRALEAVDCSAGAYNIVSGETYTWNDYFEGLATALEIAPVAQVSRAALDIDTWITGPARRAAAVIAGRASLTVTPSMRRLFRDRTRILSRRHLMADHDFVALQNGLIGAAYPLRRQADRTSAKPTARASAALVRPITR